jgi:Na+/H+ antiporter NhaD/arsenite permease-like protein
MDFILKEWLLILSATGVILTSFYIHQLPTYSLQEIEVLFILFLLFVAVNGLQKSGLILKIAQHIERGKALPLKLVLTTFFLSMFVTNDIALIVIVPLTLSLRIHRKDILVILEALAANAGSALTPLGNPQNLFLYWFYQVPPQVFIKTIAPFSLLFLLLLIAAALLLKSPPPPKKIIPEKLKKKAYLYAALLWLVFLTILHILPVWVGGIVLLFALLFDRQALRIDYSLLLTFFFFFGIAENLKTILLPEITSSEHLFLFSALTSQLMSNVPTALLFAKFTSNWPDLLWGVNAGGFGSLFGSLANLIAYKIYLTHDTTDKPGNFTIKFLLIGYVAFFISAGLYFILH